MTDTKGYYDRRAQNFFDETVGLDLAALYEPFLALLPSPAKILDAGCGSGRDALAFTSLGHEVTAFDGSPRMAALAGELLGTPVEVMRFQDVAWRCEFDGVWACASLLHVPLVELPDVLSRMAAALRPGGVVYMSFKDGDGERGKAGRRFTDLREARLRSLIAGQIDLEVVSVWMTSDVRPGREDYAWVNALAMRAP